MPNVVHLSDLQSCFPTSQSKPQGPEEFSYLLFLYWVLRPSPGIGLLEEKPFGPGVGGICKLIQADPSTPHGLVAEPGVDIGTQNSHFK